MPNIELIQGDCLEKMKDIPDKSIDMILCDLPYGARPNQIGKQYEAQTGFPNNVLEYNNVTGKKAVHPTQKPVALFEYLIKTYTNEGDLVLDNCMGSGTTGVSCKNLNRNFIGIELDPEYFKIAENRINENV